MTIATVNYKLGDTVNLPEIDLSGSEPEPVTVTLNPSKDSVEWITGNYGDLAMYTTGPNNKQLKFKGSRVDVNDALANLYIITDVLGSWNIQVDIVDGNSNNTFSDSYAMSGSKRFASPVVTYTGGVVDVSNYTNPITTSFNFINDSNANAIEVELVQSQDKKGQYDIDRANEGIKKVGKLNIPKYEFKAGTRLITDGSNPISLNGDTITANNIDFEAEGWRVNNYVKVLLTDGILGVFPITDINGDTLYIAGEATGPVAGLELIEFYAYGTKSEIEAFLDSIELEINSYSITPFEINVVVRDSGGENVAKIPFYDGITVENYNFPNTVQEGETYSLPAINIVYSDTTVTLKYQLSDPNAGSISTPTSGSTTATYDNSTGLWQATGDIAEVENVANNAQLTVSDGYLQDFSIDITLEDSNNNPQFTTTENITEKSEPTEVNVDLTSQSLYENQTYSFSNLFNTVALTDDDNNEWTLEVQVDPQYGTLSSSGNMAYNATTGTLSRGPITDLNSLEGEIDQISLNLNDNIKGEDFDIIIRVDDGVFGFNGQSVNVTESSNPVSISSTSQTHVYFPKTNNSGSFVYPNEFSFSFNDSNPQAASESYDLIFNFANSFNLDMDSTSITGSWSSSQQSYSYTSNDLTDISNTFESDIKNYLNFSNNNILNFIGVLTIDNGLLNQEDHNFEYASSLKHSDFTITEPDYSVRLPFHQSALGRPNYLNLWKVADESLLGDRFVMIGRDSANSILRMCRLDNLNNTTPSVNVIRSYAHGNEIRFIALDTFYSSGSNIRIVYVDIYEVNGSNVTELYYITYDTNNDLFGTPTQILSYTEVYSLGVGVNKIESIDVGDGKILVVARGPGALYYSEIDFNGNIVTSPVEYTSDTNLGYASDGVTNDITKQVIDRVPNQYTIYDPRTTSNFITITNPSMLAGNTSDIFLRQGLLNSIDNNLIIFNDNSYQYEGYLEINGSEYIITILYSSTNFNYSPIVARLNGLNVYDSDLNIKGITNVQ